MFFDIIKTDTEIRTATGLPKFIKMHGSLDKKNIVFREKDYLEYSQNFPLIENYIKGVFSTDVVILVGYSLGDPNVKQIISWVNFHSNNTKQDRGQNGVKTIYFIKTNATFDPIEFRFYENKNIHVLYLSEFFDKKAENEKSGHESELKNFFDEIKKKKRSLIQHSF
ncbi:SIR2 family protein [Helicobacter bizzozeronii]